MTTQNDEDEALMDISLYNMNPKDFPTDDLAAEIINYTKGDFNILEKVLNVMSTDITGTLRGLVFEHYSGFLKLVDDIGQVSTDLKEMRKLALDSRLAINELSQVSFISTVHQATTGTTMMDSSIKKANQRKGEGIVDSSTTTTAKNSPNFTPQKDGQERSSFQASADRQKLSSILQGAPTTMMMKKKRKKGGGKYWLNEERPKLVNCKKAPNGEIQSSLFAVSGAMLVVDGDDRNYQGGSSSKIGGKSVTSSNPHHQEAEAAKQWTKVICDEIQQLIFARNFSEATTFFLDRLKEATMKKRGHPHCEAAILQWESILVKEICVELNRMPLSLVHTVASPLYELLLKLGHTTEACQNFLLLQRRWLEWEVQRTITHAATRVDSTISGACLLAADICVAILISTLEQHQRLFSSGSDILSTPTSCPSSSAGTHLSHQQRGGKQQSGPLHSATSPTSSIVVQQRKSCNSSSSSSPTDASGLLLLWVRDCLHYLVQRVLSVKLQSIDLSPVQSRNSLNSVVKQLHHEDSRGVNLKGSTGGANPKGTSSSTRGGSGGLFSQTMLSTAWMPSRNHIAFFLATHAPLFEATTIIAETARRFSALERGGISHCEVNVASHLVSTSIVSLLLKQQKIQDQRKLLVFEDIAKGLSLLVTLAKHTGDLTSVPQSLSERKLVRRALASSILQSRNQCRVFFEHHVAFMIYQLIQVISPSSGPHLSSSAIALRHFLLSDNSFVAFFESFWSAKHSCAACLFPLLNSLQISALSSSNFISSSAPSSAQPFLSSVEGKGGDATQQQKLPTFKTVGSTEKSCTSTPSLITFQDLTCALLLPIIGLITSSNKSNETEGKRKSTDGEEEADLFLHRFAMRDPVFVDMVDASVQQVCRSTLLSLQNLASDFESYCEKVRYHNSNATKEEFRESVISSVPFCLDTRHRRGEGNDDDDEEEKFFEGNQTFYHPMFDLVAYSSQQEQGDKKREANNNNKNFFLLSAAQKHNSFLKSISLAMVNEVVQAMVTLRFAQQCLSAVFDFGGSSAAHVVCEEVHSRSQMKKKNPTSDVISPTMATGKKRSPSPPEKGGNNDDISNNNSKKNSSPFLPSSGIHHTRKLLSRCYEFANDLSQNNLLFPTSRFLNEEEGTMKKVIEKKKIKEILLGGHDISYLIAGGFGCYISDKAVTLDVDDTADGSSSMKKSAQRQRHPFSIFATFLHPGIIQKTKNRRKQHPQATTQYLMSGGTHEGEDDASTSFISFPQFTFGFKDRFGIDNEIGNERGEGTEDSGATLFPLAVQIVFNLIHYTEVALCWNTRRRNGSSIDSTMGQPSSFLVSSFSHLKLSEDDGYFLDEEEDEQGSDQEAEFHNLNSNVSFQSTFDSPGAGKKKKAQNNNVNSSSTSNDPISLLTSSGNSWQELHSQCILEVLSSSLASGILSKAEAKEVSVSVGKLIPEDLSLTTKIYTLQCMALQLFESFLCDELFWVGKKIKILRKEEPEEHNKRKEEEEDEEDYPTLSVLQIELCCRVILEVLRPVLEVQTPLHHFVPHQQPSSSSVSSMSEQESTGTEFPSCYEIILSKMIESVDFFSSESSTTTKKASSMQRDVQKLMGVNIFAFIDESERSSSSSGDKEKEEEKLSLDDLQKYFAAISERLSFG